MSGQRQILQQQGGKVKAASWAGESAVAFLDKAGVVFRVDLREGGEPRRIGGFEGASDLAADPRSGVVAAWESLSGEVRLWNAAGEPLARHNLGHVAIGALAIADGGTRFGVAGSLVTVVEVGGDTVLARGSRPDVLDRIEYHSAVLAGHRFVAWPGGEQGLDVWDVSHDPATVDTQNCRCGAFRHVIDPDAEQAAFSTLIGELVLWNIGSGQVAAEKTVVTSTNEDAEPLAIVRNRYVLFVIEREVDGRSVPGPLMAWDTRTDSVVTLWTCPGCEIRTMSRRPGSDEVLVATDTGYWIAVVAP
jgi:hypothetical protein